MEKSADFVLQIKSKLRQQGRPDTDYAVGKLIGASRQTMSNHKHNHRQVFSDEIGIRIAEFLELDPGYVLACLAAERTKRPEVKAVWERFAKSSAAALFLMFSGIPGMTPPSAHASFFDAENIHYTNKRKRRTALATL